MVMPAFAMSPDPMNPDPMSMGAMPPDPGSGMAMVPDINALLDLLAESEPTFKPKYPPGFKKPKKPDAQVIWNEARREERRNQNRIMRQMDTIRRLRFEKSGVFPRDMYARQQGDQDPYIATDLVDDWNMLCAIGASFDMRMTKRILNERHNVDGQTLEDFCMMMREEEMYRWANTGDMPLEMAEWKVATSYGQIASRHICNLEDPDYPFEDTLVDPAGFFPVYGGTRGLKKAYRVMRMTMAQAFNEWGEPSKGDLQRLYDKKGKDDDTQTISVCEYADPWWRAAVTLDGITLLPVIDHKSGFVPFIVQGGPGGEPLFTDTDKAAMADSYTGTDVRLGGEWWQTGPSEDWGMQHKNVSSIHLQRDRHDQLEAVMARVMTSIQNANNPALMIKRDVLSLGSKLPKISRTPGAVNELGLGDEVQEIPTGTPPMDMKAFMEIMQQDRSTGMIPLGMYGQQTGSQQTGNSMSVATETGMDHITPWVRMMETYHTRKNEMKIMQWRNFGHLTRFQDGEEKPFMVPVSKPTRNHEMARALTPEVIDDIGPRVSATLTRLRVQELMQYANIAGQLVPLGFPRRRLFEKMGEHDFDRMREEAMEEAEWEAVQSDEQARRMIKIPMQFETWIKGENDPDQKAFLTALRDFWMEQQQAQMQPPPQPGMPAPGGAPQGGPPPGPGGMQEPPLGAPPLNGGGAMVSSPTMNVAGLGAGPGTQGAPVGRPPI